MIYHSGETSIKLSVVIITLNEERNIERCLNSVAAVADEIVVLDSGSCDETRRICKAYHVNYHEQPFKGYALQKNDASLRATHDYILSLDADEALTETLQKSILEVKKKWMHDGYGFNRCTSFCGKWIRYGEWYPDEVVRLYDRRKAQWKGILHEHLQFGDRLAIGFVKGSLLHYSYYSVSHYLQKTDHYTDIAAKELHLQGIHPQMYHFYFKPFYRFFHAFILQKGFLDGYTGYCIAKLTANRLFLKFVKLKMLNEQDQPR